MVEKMTEQICLKPTSMDFEILKRLKAYLNLEPKLEDRRYFTADDLYRLGLVGYNPKFQRKLFGDSFPEHGSDKK